MRRTSFLWSLLAGAMVIGAPMGCGGPPEIEEVAGDPIVSAVTIPSGWKMPWASGSTYAFTGGPHSTSSLSSCTQVSVSGMSGIDFALNYNEVLGVADGTLRDWGDNGTSAPAGKWVIIDHGNGWTTRYWHLSSIDAAIQGMTKGKDFLSQGRLLGKSGNAGTGAHLHLEHRYDGIANSWHGQLLDGYRVRTMTMQANATLALNYQGTLTRGTETTSSINYAFCNNAAVTRWSGATTTIEAGASTGVSSTNTRRTVNQTNVIVDSFTRYGTGTWNSAAVGYGGSMYWVTSNGTTKKNYARWKPTLPSAGYYKIYAYIPSSNATTLQARYVVYHNNVTETAQNLNQNRNSDVWVKVGTDTQTYYFAANGTEYVELSDATGEAVGTKRIGFDALIFVKQ